MKEIETPIPKDRSQYLIPNAELKTSLDEIGITMELSEKFKIREYLDVLNNEYLGGTGVVSGPEMLIDSGFIKTQADDRDKRLKISSGDGYTSYELNHETGMVGIILSYISTQDWIYLTLYSRKEIGNKNKISVSEGINRSITVINDHRSGTTIKSLLFAFTEELIEGGFVEC